ncbi:MAG: PilZ domain-containing protein [Magnetococcales bacterium]|nr:PilZ domain-containing protein [Magnetococcales bacterium]
MDDAKETAVPRSRRKHERVWFKYQAVLELSGGKSLWGITRDVSLRGLFLCTTGVPAGVAVGDTGFLRLTVLNLKKEFPCRVAHVSQQGIGLELHDKGEHFGATLTASLLQETQVRLGADVSFTDHIRVTRVGASPSVVFSDGRLVKISISHMEFSFTVSPEWTLKPGEELKLEILQPRHAPIVVDGVVRSVMSGESPTEKVCALVFAVLSEKTIAEVRELVRTLHGKRLQNMMTQRSTAIGLQSGADLPRRTRPEMRQQLERFYGPRH